LSKEVEAKRVEMESELRSLIGKYGMRAVHEGLMKEMRDTFQYLQCVFELKNEIVTPSLYHNVPTVEIVNDIIPEIVHAGVENEMDDDSLVEEDVPETPKDPTVKEIKIQQPQKAKPAILSPPTIDVKQQKAKHREEVEKKKQELLAKGVKPESLLTEANLRKWLGEGYSYMKIAKETGVHEVQVTSVAKSFGLQSNISKYVAMKKKA
jgi:hypothetical protein